MRWLSGRYPWWILAGLTLVGCATDIDAQAATTSARAPAAVSASVPQPSPAGPRAPAAPSSSAQILHLIHRTTTFGYSVRQRPLMVTEIGEPGSTHRILIVGSIHGNELAGDQIATTLQNAAPRADADLWIVTEANPDGAAAGTRQNADGVDLNRNFPFRWQPLGLRGALDYSGSGALSEPESAAIAKLILRVRPTLTIWFHQSLAVVDDSQGPINVEQRFAALVGLRLARLTDYPGSVTGWEDSIFGPTAFVVELPPGMLTAGVAQRYANAVDAVATMN
jgi:protein MpaA